MTPGQSIPLSLLPIATIARETGYSPSSVRNWISDGETCPPAIVAWLRRRAMSIIDDPPPQKAAGARHQRRIT